MVTNVAGPLWRKSLNHVLPLHGAIHSRCVSGHLGTLLAEHS